MNNFNLFATMHPSDLVHYPNIMTFLLDDNLLPRERTQAVDWCMLRACVLAVATID